MPVKTNQRVIASFAIFLAISAWGIATPVIKATVEYVPPLTFLMIRFWIASIITIPLTIFFLRRTKINRERLKHILISSGLGHVIALAFIFLGLSQTNAIEASLITSLSPLIVSVLGYLILSETISRHELEGTLIAFLGTIIVVFSPLITGEKSINNDRASFIGNILFFLGILFDGLYIIYTKKYLSHDKVIKPFMQVVLSFVFAAIVFTPLGMIEQYSIYRTNTLGDLYKLPTCTVADIDRYTYAPNLACDNSGCLSTKTNVYECVIKTNRPPMIKYIWDNIASYVKPPAIIGITYMALLSGIAAYILFQLGLKYIEASEASIFYYLQPIIGIPISIIFLGEKVTLLFLVGAVTIMLGIFFAEKH